MPEFHCYTFSEVKTIDAEFTDRITELLESNETMREEVEQLSDFVHNSLLWGVK